VRVSLAVDGRQRLDRAERHPCRPLISSGALRGGVITCIGSESYADSRRLPSLAIRASFMLRFGYPSSIPLYVEEIVSLVSSTDRPVGVDGEIRPTLT
jgi:hypothetical protein